VFLDCEVPFNDNYPETDPAEASLEAFFAMGPHNALESPGLDDPFERETPHFAPLPGSPAAAGAATLSDPFFTDVPFRGGVDPENDWISRGVSDGWIYFLAL
jgi:hypothetical protein